MRYNYLEFEIVIEEELFLGGQLNETTHRYTPCHGYYKQC